MKKITNKVGITTGTLNDETRNNWAGTGPRPVAWVAWYPTSDTAQGDKLSVSSSAKSEMFVLLGGIINAPVNTTQNIWPVVLLSHGTGGSALGMDWIGHRLAQAGYIAIAVSHHGNTAIEPYLPEGFLCWWERATDLSLALDALENEGILASAMDLKRVFALGFSLGAYTVMAMAGAQTDTRLFEQWLDKSPRQGPNGPKEFPDLSEHIQPLMADNAEFRTSQTRQHNDFSDTRIKAIVTIAPPPPIRALTPQSLKTIDLPIHIIVGQSDKEAPHDTCALWLDKHLPNSHLTLLGKNVGHYVFLNQATQFGKATEPDICIDAKGVDRSETHQQTAEIAVEFFNAAMK